MNCPSVAYDINWRRNDKPIGVLFNSPHFLVQVPEDMGNNNVNFNTNRQWTNVRGYGNILVYNETSEFPIVHFSVHPWNR